MAEGEIRREYQRRPTLDAFVLVQRDTRQSKEGDVGPGGRGGPAVTSRGLPIQRCARCTAAKSGIANDRSDETE